MIIDTTCSLIIAPNLAIVMATFNTMNEKTEVKNLGLSIRLRQIASAFELYCAQIASWSSLSVTLTAVWS